MAICNYIYANCKKETLNDLCLQIEKGLNKQECMFSDAFLFLFQKHKGNKFNQTISKISSECLSDKNGSIKKFQYFKNSLLNSNIWGTMYNHVNIEDEKETNGANKSDEYDSNETLFSQICQNIKINVLKEEQEKLKQQLIELQEKHNRDFNSLKHSIRKYNLGLLGSISQNSLINTFNTTRDFMNDHDNNIHGIHPSKKLNELPIDFESGFYGSNEYDYKIYLTKVLIEAHQINPIFQNECKKFFNSLSHVGLSCQYTSAPVKTYDRCVNKSKLDYSDGDWPHSQYILDCIRCSVVFDDIGQFLNGFNQFYSKYGGNSESIGKHSGCIQGIVRIKNDFSRLPNDLKKNLKLEDCGYKDIKCNILIEHNNVRLIGEIQFILTFMLETKKKQHKIYSLLRKEDLFTELNTFYYRDDRDTQEYLNSMIMNQNFIALSLFFQTMNDNESNYILKNKSYIDDLFSLSNFEKGEKLFRSII